MYLTSIKLLFDLWPFIRFTIFEEKPCEIEEKPCKYPLEEESIHFEEVFYRVALMLLKKASCISVTNIYNIIFLFGFCWQVVFFFCASNMVNNTKATKSYTWKEFWNTLPLF